MSIHNDLAIPIPAEVIDQIADRVAEKILAILWLSLERSRQEPVSSVCNNSNQPPTTFIRLRGVVERIELARSTMYIRLSEQRFPESISLGEGSVALHREDMGEWEALMKTWRALETEIMQPRFQATHLLQVVLKETFSQ